MRAKVSGQHRRMNCMPLASLIGPPVTSVREPGWESDRSGAVVMVADRVGCQLCW